MMQTCYDEGTLQAFLDNELAPELSQKVARHLADCDPCAVLLAKVEEETALVFAALDEEFNTLVPTQRLWTKINQSIEAESRRRSPWQSLLAFFSGFTLSSPQFAAFASLVFVVAVIAGLLTIKPDNATHVAGNVNINQPQPLTPPAVKPSATDIAQKDPEPEPEEIEPVAPKPSANQPAPYKPQQANYSEDVRRSSSSVTPRAPRRDEYNVQRLDYIPGEDAYLSTIARLEQTVNRTKDEVLKPSARFSYEKNMAVVNDAIAKMKSEVRKNPKNVAARQVLFTSYQNKIDLLNSVTDRSELMVSLR